MLRILTLSVLAITLAGCAGRISYVGPSSPPRITHSKTLSQPVERVWASTVQSLKDRGYAVEAAPSQGVIQLRVAGDPEPYLDCGQVTSRVGTARYKIRRHYQFAGAAAHTDYEQVMDGNVWDVARDMHMDTVVHIRLQRAGANHTQADLEARYLLTRHLKFHNATHKPYEPIVDSIRFNSFSKGQFPNGIGQSTECVATGALEKQILDLIR